MRAKAQQFLTEALGITLPYYPMGRIDSLDLFGFTELMILQIYKENMGRWKRALDIGANIGLHSIMMAKSGFYVEAYEPQPDIFRELERNVKKLTSRITIHQAAVHATKRHKMNLTVVENNLTGSHLEGFKDSYGPRHTIVVKTVNCVDLWPHFDFAKIDSEGNEAELSLTMDSLVMSHMDCVMEVRNETNAEKIYHHFKSIGVPIWAQKIDWNKVSRLDEMPRMNREGSIFVGHKGPW